LDFIVKDTSFESMKQRPLFYDLVRSSDAAKFLRGGRVGDGRATLSAAQIARFEARCAREFVDEWREFPWKRVDVGKK
jgi:hypothetical protein